MSAIWGHVDFEKDSCSVTTMASEYERKCKLDRITEKPFKNALFGHGLQVINDEDKYEELPAVTDGGKTIITADCYLFNREELISTLGISDKGVSDGKIIELSYNKWHYDLVRHIRGLFSLAIFNTEKKELFLCTDQAAARCLYYYTYREGCTFSTLLSPLISLHNEIERNENYLKDFLCAPGLLPILTSTETPWEKVFLVDAGSYLLIRPDGVKTIKYYVPGNMKVPHNIIGAKKKFLKVYDKAVKESLRTNGEVSITLSGGFDSSSVAAMAANNLKHLGKKLHSYTYVPFYKEIQKEMPVHFSADETELVKKTVGMYPNIDPHFEDDGGKDFIDSVDEMLDVLEIPYKAYVNLATLGRIYKKAADNGSKIFLSGQNGNFTVSYGNIYNVLYYLKKNHRWLSYLRYYNNYYKAVKMSRRESFKYVLKYLDGEYKKDQNGVDGGNPYVKKDIEKGYNKSERLSLSPIVSVDQISAGREELKRLMCYAGTYMGQIDTKLGLYFGVLFADPTRHPDIMDYCAAVPYEYYCYKGVPRYLIRGFMKDFLPKEILYPYERYGVQTADWLLRIKNKKENVYSDVLNKLSCEEVKDYIDIGQVKEFIDSDPTLGEDNSFCFTMIFNAFVFSKYMRNSQ